MKGIALPVEYLVILIIAVIVLLAVVAFFILGWDPFGFYLEQAKNKACGILTRNQCKGEALEYEVYDLDLCPRDGTPDGAWTVLEVCSIYLKGCRGGGPADIVTEKECLRLCGC